MVVKARVKEGRFELVGAMWTEPDCNLPSGEALIWHILYSKQFAKEYFDVDIRVGYNVDSFGHGSNLPAILENLRLTEELLDRYDYDRQAVFYGVGNHGGGPTIDNIRTICELREERPDLDLDFSTMKEFFDSVNTETLPKFKGELGRINMGCYSSDNEIKRLNRQGMRRVMISGIRSRLPDGLRRMPYRESQAALIPEEKTSRFCC